jgi:hypothetical protein
MSQESQISMPPVELEELNKKIVDDTVIEYNNKNDLIKVLDKIKNENETVIKDYVELVVMLTEQLALIMTGSIISQNKNFIIEQIKGHSKFFMDEYIDRAYNKTNGLYRKNIIMQNENFFLNNNFDDITNGETSIVNRLFMFKDFWFKLKEENKVILKYYLSTMCYYADTRYINFNKYKVIRAMNKNKYMNIFNIYDNII